jgi:hypothetical protein
MFIDSVCDTQYTHFRCEIKLLMLGRDIISDSSERYSNKCCMCTEHQIFIFKPGGT